MLVDQQHGNPIRQMANPAAFFVDNGRSALRTDNRSSTSANIALTVDGLDVPSLQPNAIERSREREPNRDLIVGNIQNSSDGSGCQFSGGISVRAIRNFSIAANRNGITFPNCNASVHKARPQNVPRNACRSFLDDNPGMKRGFPKRQLGYVARL
jgi:hypothetical protein